MGSDWPILAQELNVPDKDIDRISDDVSDPDKRGLEMLQLWVKQAGIMATGKQSESNSSNSTFQSINHSIYIIYRLNGLSIEVLNMFILPLWVYPITPLIQQSLLIIRHI